MSTNPKEYVEFSLPNDEEPKAARRLRFPVGSNLLSDDSEGEGGSRLSLVARAKELGKTRIESLSLSDEEVATFVKEKEAELMKELAVKHAVAFLKEATKKGLIKDSKDMRDAVTLVMANLSETLYKQEGNVSDLESYAYTIHPFLKEHIEQVIHLATHDMLTGALNKFGLEWYISEEFDNIEAGLGIDLTNFKAVNDNFGHQRGDEVLRDVTELLKKALRDHDEVARIGGDEFFAVLRDKTKDGSVGQQDQQKRQLSAKLSPIEVANIAAGRIADAIKAYLDDNPELKEIGFDMAVGAVPWRKGVSSDVLMAEADENMWQHKRGQHEQKGKYRDPLTK